MVRVGPHRGQVQVVAAVEVVSRPHVSALSFSPSPSPSAAALVSKARVQAPDDETGAGVGEDVHQARNSQRRSRRRCSGAPRCMRRAGPGARRPSSNARSPRYSTCGRWARWCGRGHQLDAPAGRERGLGTRRVRCALRARVLAANGGHRDERGKYPTARASDGIMPPKPPRKGRTVSRRDARRG